MMQNMINRGGGRGGLRVDGDNFMQTEMRTFSLSYYYYTKALSANALHGVVIKSGRGGTLIIEYIFKGVVDFIRASVLNGI